MDRPGCQEPAEQLRQFILIALGESFTAIGLGAARKAISTPLIVAAVLGIAVALSLWWLYFDVISRAAEDRLRDAQGQARARMALEAYSYGHFPIVAGITAFGVEGVLAHAGDTRPLGAFDALVLLGGPALYLTGHLIFKNRMQYPLSRPRLITALLLLAATPAAAALPPLAGLAGLVAILAVLFITETIRYAAVRRRQREA
jgi:low temperature requirement protein LtrA